jgi:DHA1 family multidrug resistance protein-like MFS transporter
MTLAPARSETRERSELRLVGALSTATFLEWVGAGAMLPLLPLFLRRHGGSDVVVGAVMSAFFAAQLLVSYPAGRLADRVGPRAVLLGGLLCYAVASFGFLAPSGPLPYIALRAGQGLGSGAAQVAILSLVASRVRVGLRGRAFGAVYGAQIAGLAVGPFAGSMAGLSNMGLLFVTAGIVAVIACLPAIVATPGALPTPAAPQADSGLSTRQVRANHRLLGVLLAGLAIGMLAGVYETCWSLLLHIRHASSWQIGLSWSLFALPFTVASVPAGWLADRFDRRWLVVGSLTSSVCFTCLYPFLQNVGLLVGLGVIDAVGWALAYPAAQSLLSQAASVSDVGKAQGLFSGSQTAATALGAAAGGALFALSPWVPFVLAGAGAAVITTSLPRVWVAVPGVVGR